MARNRFAVIERHLFVGGYCFRHERGTGAIHGFAEPGYLFCRPLKQIKPIRVGFTAKGA